MMKLFVCTITHDKMRKRIFFNEETHTLCLEDGSRPPNYDNHAIKDWHDAHKWAHFYWPTADPLWKTRYYRSPEDGGEPWDIE